MKIFGVVVCVNYADLLARGIERWRDGLERLVVVTASHDTMTQELCGRHGVECFVTDIFYYGGAKFNKGAALSEAIHKTGLRGDHWILTFDADIVPPKDWRAQVECFAPQKGHLYGALRYQQPENAKELRVVPTARMPQSWVIGFFMLFHSQDPIVGDGPVFDLCWPHAGNYDTIFCRKWPTGSHILMPLDTIHLGNERENWVGRGKADELNAMLLRRNGHEGWESERMANPPSIEGL